MSRTMSAGQLGDDRFFELSLDLLGVIGFDGYLKRVNPAWERTLGWRADELTARPYGEFIHVEDRQRTLDEAARLAEPGAETHDFELRFVSRAGDWKWLLFSAQGIAEEGLIYAVGKDITERKAAEAALQDSERRFRAVTESVNDAIISADAEGRIMFWNEAAAKMFGRSAEEAVGRELVEFMPERYRASHLEGLERLREGAEPRVMGRSVELDGLRGDGTEFPLELSLGGWRLGDARFYTGVIRDLTNRRHAERYVAAQHGVADILIDSPSVEAAMPALLRAVGETIGWAAGGFWLPDPDRDTLRCHVFWSREPERFAAFEAATRDLVLSRGEGLPGQVLASGEPEWVPDVTGAENSPRGQVASDAGLHGAIGLPVVSEGGQVVAVVDFFTFELGRPDDAVLEIMSTISKQLGQFLRRKQAEEALSRTAAELRRRAEALERSNAELEQFAYVASHDLSEPLRMVAGFVQLLSDRYKGRLDEDADEFIAYTVDGVSRMQRLIDDLLAYSRVGQQTDDGDVDLEAVLRHALSSLAPLVAESGAVVESGPLPVVFGDARELEQLVQNLLSNAIKFVDPGPPRVEVSAREVEGMWEVAIADNGIGIEARHADRVFKMFQRLHGRESYPGTGIGLAICKKIAERLDGTITVEPRDGGGSVFRATLPAAAEGPE
jgi:PAS domain S-box-containing protein